MYNMKITRNKGQSSKPKQTEKPFTIITGASAGIGEATALELAKKNTSLVLTARRLDRLKALQKKCVAAGAPSVLIFKLDVQSQKQIAEFSKELAAKKIRIKNLINCAGLARGVELFQNSNPSDWDAMLDTNVRGLLYVTRAIIPFVIAEKGHIINLGSVAGRLVYEGGAVYCASKFAVRAISDALRFDLKGTGVRVSNIEPGMVNTEFSKVRLGSQQKADALYNEMMPLSAIDIAETILWCLSQPPHVNISELVIYPTDQASVGHVVRGEKSVLNLFK